MGIQARVGDVFLIPLNGQSWACGQVVSAWNAELYVAIFASKVNRQFEPANIIAQEPIFLTLTLDAKLYHGEWPIIGNIQENLARLPQPAFKVRQSGVAYVESRDRTSSRPAAPEEAEILKYRTVSSPAVVQNGVQAHFGIGEWSSKYEDMRADYAYKSSLLLAV